VFEYITCNIRKSMCNRTKFHFLMKFHLQSQNAHYD